MLVAKFSHLKLHLLAIILMLAVISSGVFWASRILVSAQEPDPSVINDLNKQIDEQRQKIDALADEIEKHNANIKKARSESANLQNQIYILDNQIAKTNLDLSAKEEEVKATELEIQKVELEIKEKESMINKDKAQLSAFIRQLDVYDERDYLSILLGNNSFSEFFDQVKYLENIQGDLQKTLNRVQELVESLSKQKTDLDSKRTQLSELLNKLEEQKAKLGDQKGTKQYLAAQTKLSERKFQGLVSQLKQEQTAANNQMAALERRLREELAKKGSGEKFNTLGDAALIWPLANVTVTCYFHDPDYPFRNLFEHSGVDLRASLGTPVRAAEAGYVAKVAVGTRWYGTYVMIIHNNNLATLYGHLSSTNVSGDQYVAKGQTIGYSGNTGFSTGPHLHFEVRYNGIPTNPLGYLP